MISVRAIQKYFYVWELEVKIGSKFKKKKKWTADLSLYFPPPRDKIKYDASKLLSSLLLVVAEAVVEKQET